MITLQIKYLSNTDTLGNRWKVIGETSEGLKSLTIETNECGFMRAAEQFVAKHWADCEVLNYGQLPTGERDMVALVARIN
jgi:hypothetical protein